MADRSRLMKALSTEDGARAAFDEARACVACGAALAAARVALQRSSARVPRRAKEALAAASRVSTRRLAAAPRPANGRAGVAFALAAAIASAGFVFALTRSSEPP